jgi:hypothetical protein
MTLRNGKVYRLEDGIPGTPRIYHLAIHRACDRFLASRGLITDPTSRRHAWLFGAKRRAAK